MVKIQKIILCLMPLLLLLSCSLPAKQADENLALSNKLTYGMAKKHIKSGETTQAEVLELFGSPDNMVLKNGKEMWIYDRFRVETETSSATGYGTILLAGGSANSSRTSTYTKTITIIINFTKDSVVVDFNMRVGGY